MKQENDYIVQFSGDTTEDAPPVSVAINQYWNKDPDTEAKNYPNQKGAE